MDSWVTHITFRETTIKITIVIAYINCETTLFVCTTSELVFSPIFRDFRCTLHFRRLKAVNDVINELRMKWVCSKRVFTILIQ